MLPVQLDQPLPGQPPQPGIERQGTAPQVVVHGPVGLGKGVLDDVRWVHAGRELAIHANRDHLPQPRLMPDQQVVAGLAVAPRGLLDELCGIRCLGEHGNFDLQDLMCETGGRRFRSAESFFGPRTGEAVMSRPLAG